MSAINTALRGRDEQMSLIREQLVGAAVGRGSIVLIEGRPGFGKTRLLDESTEIANNLGIRVGRGAVTTSDQGVPLGAVLGAMFDCDEPLVERSERSRLPYLPEQRYLLLDELESLLEQAAMRAPTLLCLDDLQWREPASHMVLRSLPVRLATVPIVWLIAYRPGRELPELADMVEGLMRSHASKLELGPLDAEATRQVVGDVMGAEPDEALLDIARRAHGNPFLLVELLRGLREEGLVSVEAGQARLTATRLPARVRDTMRDRLGRMSDAASTVAGVASVLGRTFSFDQLARMLDAAPAALLDPVQELLNAELLSQQQDALTFRHDLLREAVRDSLPASALHALQRQAVDVLLSSGAVPAEVAAQLAVSATPGDQDAVRTLGDAAQAVGGSDPSTAADLSARALELAGPDAPSRGPLAAQAVLLLHAAGRIAEGKAFADGVLGEALPAEQEAEVRLSLAGMTGVAPDVRADAGRRALALSGLPPPLRARHLAYLVQNLLVAGRALDAAALLPEAREAAQASADPNASSELTLAESVIAGMRGDLESSLELVEEVRRTRIEPVRAVLAQGVRAMVLAALDRYDESIAQIVERLATEQRHRQKWAVRLWEGWRGRQLLQLGQLFDAAAALEGVVETPGELALVGAVEAAAVVALGRTAIHTADAARLERCVGIMHGMLDSGTPGVQRFAAWLLAQQAMAAGDPTAARECLCAMGVEERLNVVPMLPIDVTDEVSLVRIARAAGDTELVSSATFSADERARLNPKVASIVGTAAHTRGLATGNLADLLQAVGWLGQGPRRLAHASALEDAGRTAAQLGQRERGVAMLGFALEIYTGVGAVWDARRVRGRLRDLGVRRRIVSADRPAHGWAGLTDSELDVVRRVADGMTNREVAEQLFVSTNTVSTHLRHAFTKLDINSRVELARLAAEHGQATM